MASPVFDDVFAILIGEEGGYTNDPHDPGGATKYGITAADNPGVAIADLTVAQAKAIYFAKYWAKASCDVYPAPLALMVFDAAVNNGVQRACEWVQAAVGVPADGEIGPQTRAALAAALADARVGVDGVCAEFLARRMDFMGGLQTWKYFGLGWSRRLAALPYKAKGLAAS